MLQAEEEALLLQQYVGSEDDGHVEQKIRGYIDQVLMYEDPERQETARKTVPVDELEKALVAIAKRDYHEGMYDPTKDERDHAFLLELLFWFKQSFSWVHAPPCDGCRNQTTSQGMCEALGEEVRYGGVRVELYRCSYCSRNTRFPRYNDPMKLLETRKGRCGEWANCFTLYCRAFGYESRLVSTVLNRFQMIFEQPRSKNEQVAPPRKSLEHELSQIHPDTGVCPKDTVVWHVDIAKIAQQGSTRPDYS